MSKLLPLVWTRVYLALAAKFYPSHVLPDVDPVDDWAPYEAIRDWAIDAKVECHVTLADQLELVKELTANGTLGEASCVHSVAFYDVDLAYGGPEEGGWYFQYGEPSTEAELMLQTKLFTAFFDPQYLVLRPSAEAKSYVVSLLPKLDALNEGRPDISSVASIGKYAILIEEGYPKSFPASKPQYE